ncbi:DotI/IcmL family type IV secretion protein [Achromobacter insolitus]|uniref:DotI/IcmL family type IV secretion protein n=1 Tax=Achromobacter insolitus TaxID=217204 RepID=UPI0007C27CA6|nr:DotI/IcmL family type IV secretion protein [Achromobacter insolitus]OAD16431.1 type IV secretion protein DotI [Achromobacter insolitus]
MFGKKSSREESKTDASRELKDAPKELERLSALAADPSAGEGASVLREVARLQLDLAIEKKRNLRIWGANVALSTAIALLVGGFLYVYPKYRYIPTTDNRAICEVTAESTPRVSGADVTNFAKDAVLNSYSYDYVNYRTIINEAAARWYTDEGRRAFMQGLDSSGNLRRVIEGRMILRSMSTRTPQLEEITPSTGIPESWLVIAPIAIEFYVGGSEKPLSRQDFNAHVKVVRVQASAANQKGIAVESVVLKPPRNN